MPDAILVCGGAAPAYTAIQRLLAERPFICAADSGLDSLHRWGCMPDLIVGDMDSLSSRELLEGYRRQGCRISEQSSHKDDTDTETGLRMLREAGYNHISIVGGGGGRLDHILAIRALFDRPDGPEEWYTDRERIIKLTSSVSLDLEPGQLVSVFPLGDRGARQMKSSGLQWPLAGLDWPPGHFGISNRSIGSSISIDPGPQALLVILPLP